MDFCAVFWTPCEHALPCSGCGLPWHCSVMVGQPETTMPRCKQGHIQSHHPSMHQTASPLLYLRHPILWTQSRLQWCGGKVSLIRLIQNILQLELSCTCLCISCAGLWTASQAGHTDIVKQLLEAGAIVDTINLLGEVCLLANCTVPQVSLTSSLSSPTLSERSLWRVPDT